MGDGFSLNLTKADLNCISNQYLYLKKTAENVRSSVNFVEGIRDYYQFDGFKMALIYLGIDPKIFENGIEPLE